MQQLNARREFHALVFVILVCVLEHREFVQDPPVNLRVSIERVYRFNFIVFYDQFLRLAAYQVYSAICFKFVKF